MTAAPMADESTGAGSSVDKSVFGRVRAALTGKLKIAEVDHVDTDGCSGTFWCLPLRVKILVMLVCVGVLYHKRNDAIKGNLEG
jgi:hypothetical protein